MLIVINFGGFATTLARQNQAVVGAVEMLAHQKTIECLNAMQQALLNYATNAIKFTPRDGQVIVSIEKFLGFVGILVRDNGIGVLKQDAAYIFDRFYKADKAHAPGSGTGLGLSISKMILEKHGQHIELLDSEDGAAFRFTLQRVNGHEGSK